MLVLSRKLGEKITIDGDIEIEVLEVSANRVRIGISAPRNCRILRAERRPGDSVRRERRRAATLAGSGV